MAEANPTPEYNCLLCMKPYNNARELPCYHTFCCSCLTSYIDEEHRTADEDRHYFPCPVCDTPTSPRDVNTDISTWGSLFPENNLFINQTAKTSGGQNCVACGRVGESNPAIIWCTGCVEMLCKQCRDSHKRNKMTAKHRLVPIKDGEFYDTTLNEYCTNHEGRPLEVYCLDHSMMCCHMCVSVSHRACNHIKPIDDVIKIGITEQPSRETAWEDIKDEAAVMLEYDESELILLNTKEKQVSAEATRRIQPAKDKLDGLHTTFQSTLAHQCKVHRQKLFDRMDCVKKFQTNAVNSSILMSRFDKQGTDRQRFIIREKTKQQLSGHYRRMDQNTKRLPKSFDLKLSIGTVIDDIMKMKTIGNVDVIPKTSTTTSQTSIARIGSLLGDLVSSPPATTFADSTSTSELVGSLQHNKDGISPGMTQVDVWTGSLSYVLRVNSSSMAGRLNACFTGGMFTDNGELVVTDGNNNRLMLFDDKYRFKKEFKINGRPTDVTRGLTTDEIFVSMEDNGIMRCTLRKDQLTVTEIMKCTDDVSGIAALGDNTLVSTYRSVKVRSSDGTVKKSIKRGGDYLSPMVSSTSTSTFYYSDGNDVVCRRLDRDVEVYRYNKSSLTHPTGIGLDSDNNAYVCGYGSGNVHIVSPDGSRGKVLLSRLSSITYPYRIIVHPTKQEFVVTSTNDTISFEVYRFSDNVGDTE